MPLKVGDPVEGMASDDMWYPGVVTKIWKVGLTRNNQYGIDFLDGDSGIKLGPSKIRRRVVKVQVKTGLKKVKAKNPKAKTPKAAVRGRTGGRGERKV